MNANTKTAPNLSQWFLRECLTYNSDTGFFKWLKRPAEHFKSQAQMKRWNSCYAGTIAGGVTGGGYIQIRINNKRYMAHRLAWLYEYGEMPAKELDHLDHDKSNNKIINLRSVSHGENDKNRSMYRANTSGINGVWFNKFTNNWMAYISVKNKRFHLGMFSTRYAAAYCRHAANIKYGFHKNHGGEK